MFERSEELLTRARKSIPGGVNSPVRAFTAVGGTPPFIDRAEGAHIYDADGNEYIDFVLSWGPGIVGHAHPKVVEACQKAVARGSSFGAPTELEIELAERIIERCPGTDVVRLVNSGTEACMSAVRVARGATGRDKIIKFEGCYHGHADSFLIAAGSGATTLGVPNSPGVTRGTAHDTLLATFNEIDSVASLVDDNTGEVAAIILEPVCGNTGCLPPRDDFLKKLRKLCDDNGIVLIFDEVMTGFRIAKGGAAERFGVTPDMSTFGKVVGGGFPLAAYAGKEEIMRHVAPDGPVYQAGTLSGNPVAVTAGIETLKLLDDDVYDQLEALGSRLQSGIDELIEQRDLPLCTERVGSMFSLFFTPEIPVDHDDVKACDIDRFNQFFHASLKNGVYLAPSQFEAGFLSTAHTDEIIDQVIDKTADALDEVY